MDFRMLGPFEVWNNGMQVPLGGRRQRAVLALLAIHAGEVLSTDRIVEEIWAEDSPPSAVRTVHAYISRLRSNLRGGNPVGSGSEILVSRDPGYVLAIDPMQVDAARFEQAVSQASACLKAGDPTRANGELPGCPGALARHRSRRFRLRVIRGDRVTTSFRTATGGHRASDRHRSRFGPAFTTGCRTRESCRQLPDERALLGTADARVVP